LCGNLGNTHAHDTCADDGDFMNCHNQNSILMTILINTPIISS
jgi:hypothetical protein